MKVAIIDMGTNTFHLIIVMVSEGEFKILYREKSAVKIGEKGINKGMITEDATERAVSTLKKFKDRIDEHGVTEIYATATSAIRNAKNGLDIVELIHKETGIATRIISGIQEAEYIYYGVQKAMDIGPDPVLIMDIGGGSIEFIIGTNTQILWRQSFEIGGLRMVEKFHRHDPIQQNEIIEVEQYLEENLSELVEAHQKHRPLTLVGSSGTFDTLSDIYCLKNGITRLEDQTELPLEFDEFQSIYEELLSKTKSQRLAIPGMVPLRVDMIVVATILVNYVLEKLEISDIRVSAYALKEGVLLNTINSLEA